MKLTIDSRALADVVTWTARALPNRAPNPALNGLLLAGGTNGLIVSAFDYDTSRRRTVAAEIGEPGKILVPGRVLAEVVKALPTGKQVDMYLFDDRELVITCGSATFTLPTMPIDDYPRLPEPLDGTGSINGRELADAVAQVVRAASKDSTLPMLTGIRVDVAGDTITMASTDRYRMASRTLPWSPVEADATEGVVIPGAVLAEIVKSMPEGEVTISLSDTLASIQGGGAVATVRLLDSEFPDIQARLRTEDFPIWATADVHELTNVVRRVALMAERAAPVHLAFTAGQVVVRAGGEDGRASEAMPVDVEGDDIEIAFQPQYLLDGLLGISGETVRIGMTKPAAPALLVDNTEDPDYRYLVMALRVAS